MCLKIGGVDQSELHGRGLSAPCRAPQDRRGITRMLFTYQQAADLLNISRQHLEYLLAEEQLESTETGDGPRILLADALALKQERDARRREGLRELTHLTEKLGGYEHELEQAGAEDEAEPPSHEP